MNTRIFASLSNNITSTTKAPRSWNSSAVDEVPLRDSLRVPIFQKTGAEMERTKWVTIQILPALYSFVSALICYYLPGTLYRVMT